MSSIQWGDVAGWIGAVFLGAAFMGTMLLFRIEHGRDRRSEERRLATIKAQLEEQASRISAWYDPQAFKYAEGAVPGFQWVCVVNSSLDPVYDCELKVFISDILLAEVVLTIVPPIATIQVVKLDYVQIPSAAKTVAVCLNFMDAAGRRWIRDGHGQLSRLAAGPEPV